MVKSIFKAIQRRAGDQRLVLVRRRSSTISPWGKAVQFVVGAAQARPRRPDEDQRPEQPISSSRDPHCPLRMTGAANAESRKTDPSPLTLFTVCSTASPRSESGLWPSEACLREQTSLVGRAPRKPLPQPRGLWITPVLSPWRRKPRSYRLRRYGHHAYYYRVHTFRGVGSVSKLKKFKDPLYGYIYYSALEEAILSHRLVLRLHHIRQNGAAFLTYPSIRVHRFEHSLGAMHVAGLLFKHAVEFSTDAQIDRHLVEVVEAILGQNIDTAKQELEKAGPRGEDLIGRDGLYKLHNLHITRDKNAFAKLLMFQAIRLASLVHDIGHPPFSHTFEVALKQVSGEIYEDHEHVGLELLELVIADLEKDLHGTQYFLARKVLEITKSIIDKKNKHHWRVEGVATIISGDIDSDRLDYVRRDTVSAGLTTNAYDLGRIVDAVKLEGQLVDGKQTALYLIFTADALSTIETFFSVRFHQYRWMLWHHNVVRQNMILILIIKLMRQISFSERELQNSVSDLFDVALNKERRRDYWYFTDYYFLDKLAYLLRQLEKDLAKIPTKSENGRAQRNLCKYLQTFLYRRKEFFASFWKRPDDYFRFAKIVLGDDGEVGLDDNSIVPTFNDLCATSFEKLSKRHAEAAKIDYDNPGVFGAYRSEKIDFLTGAFCTAIEESINNALSAFNCSTRAYYLARFNPGPAGLKLRSQVGENLQFIDVGILSPSVKALDLAWMGLPQLWLFLEHPLESDEGSGPPTARPQPSDLYHVVGQSLRGFLRGA
jgi:HD superfamily phosphohydrolase